MHHAIECAESNGAGYWCGSYVALSNDMRRVNLNDNFNIVAVGVWIHVFSHGHAGRPRSESALSD